MGYTVFAGQWQGVARNLDQRHASGALPSFRGSVQSRWLCEVQVR
jgi:hypothetical protein